MTIHYIKHDVTNVVRGVVAHGCNCQGVMGSGVAKAIRAKWPKAYDRYNKLVTITRDAGVNTSELLGLSLLVNVGAEDSEINSLFVANLFTQDRFGSDGKAYASSDAVRASLRDVMSFCRGANLPLYMPQIGCGLGGLSWERDVRPIVEELHAEHMIEVYVCLL